MLFVFSADKRASGMRKFPGTRTLKRMLQYSRYALGLATAGILLIGPNSLGAQTLPPALRSCAKIADDTARLACFDHEVARDSVTDPPGKEPTPASLSPEEKLGLSERRVQRLESTGTAQPQEISKLQAHIVRTSSGRDGRDVFELDNGQTWQQTEAQLSFTARPGDTVTITKGALGSFWLTKSPSQQAARVKRLR
jgi:hypothetical protein